MMKKYQVLAALLLLSCSVERVNASSESTSPSLSPSPSTLPSPAPTSEISEGSSTSNVQNSPDTSISEECELVIDCLESKLSGMELEEPSALDTLRSCCEDSKGGIWWSKRCFPKNFSTTKGIVVTVDLFRGGLEGRRSNDVPAEMKLVYAGVDEMDCFCKKAVDSDVNVDNLQTSNRNIISSTKKYQGCDTQKMHKSWFVNMLDHSYATFKIRPFPDGESSNRLLLSPSPTHLYKSLAGRLNLRNIHSIENTPINETTDIERLFAGYSTRPPKNIHFLPSVITEYRSGHFPDAIWSLLSSFNFISKQYEVDSLPSQLAISNDYISIGDGTKKYFVVLDSSFSSELPHLRCGVFESLKSLPDSPAKCPNDSDQILKNVCSDRIYKARSISYYNSDAKIEVMYLDPGLFESMCGFFSNAHTGVRLRQH